MSKHLNTNALFITGTDTGVGKTWVTGHLCYLLRKRGIDAGVWKPVETGTQRGDPNADSFRLRYISEVEDPEEMISPFVFSEPLAPYAAAKVVNQKAPTIAEILSHFELISSQHRIILIEGAGGIAVPLNEKELMVELPIALGCPVLIVARPGLGTINHTLLTVTYAKQKGLKVIGIILNGYPFLPYSKYWNWDDILNLQKECSSEVICFISNPQVIQEFSHVPVIGKIPRIPEGYSKEEIAQWIDLDQILISMGIK